MNKGCGEWKEYAARGTVWRNGSAKDYVYSGTVVNIVRQASSIPSGSVQYLKGCAVTGFHRLAQGYPLQLTRAARISYVFKMDVIGVEIVPLQCRHRVAQFKKSPKFH